MSRYAESFICTNIELAAEALKWAAFSFKCRAMTSTSDQLNDELRAILSGQAHVQWSSHRIIYAEQIEKVRRL